LAVFPTCKETFSDNLCISWSGPSDRAGFLYSSVRRMPGTYFLHII
jgi:hypothetical protein